MLTAVCCSEAGITLQSWSREPGPLTPSQTSCWMHTVFIREHELGETVVWPRAAHSNDQQPGTVLLTSDPPGRWRISILVLKGLGGRSQAHSSRLIHGVLWVTQRKHKAVTAGEIGKTEAEWQKLLREFNEFKLSWVTFFSLYTIFLFGAEWNSCL